MSDDIDPKTFVSEAYRNAVGALAMENARLREALEQAAEALEGIRDLAPHHSSDKLLPLARVAAHVARAALSSEESSGAVS